MRKKNIAYGIIDARDIKEFQNTYRLMLAVQTYSEFDWQDDPGVEKSGLFTIGEEVMIQIPLSDSFKDRIVRTGPAVVFYYGAVPINVKVQDARTLKDIIDQGGIIKVGGSMGVFLIYRLFIRRRHSALASSSCVTKSSCGGLPKFACGLHIYAPAFPKYSILTLLFRDVRGVT